MNKIKFKKIILIISIMTASLLILTSCGDLITKVEPEETEVEETNVVKEEPEEKEEEDKKEPEEEPQVSELEGERYAIVSDVDLSRVEDTLQKPENLQKGEVVYIHRIENGLAFVDVIRDFGDLPLTFEPHGGYIPAENLILNPTEDNYKDKSITFHVKPGNIRGTETITNNEVEIKGDVYVVAQEIEDDQILIIQPGGAHSAWISKNDTDFDFTRFTGYK